MTISTTTTRVSYSGNGTTTAFSFPYRFLLETDLVVVITDSDGVETTQTLTTDYTTTGAGGDSGGTVTMITAPASGETLTISRVVDVTQETDYISGDAFPAETHEAALDKLTMIDQQLTEDSRRSIKIPVSSSISSAELTQLPEDRPNYYVRVNSAGDAFELVAPASAETNSSVISEVHIATADQTIFNLSNSYSEGINHLQVYINGVKQRPNAAYTETDSTTVTFVSGLDAGDEVEFSIGILEPNNVASAANVAYTPDGTGAVASNVQTKLRETVSVKDFGAVGDGVTDDTAAIQLALDNGGDIYFPDGTYYVTKASLEAITTRSAYGLTPEANSRIEFSSGAWIQLESGVDVRHVFAVLLVDNVTFLNPNIDCNDSASNGIGGSSATNCKIIGGTIKNVAAGAQYSDTTAALGGGKAITFQYNCDNITITGTTFVDCFICVDLVGKQSGDSQGISVSSITAQNCNMIVGCISGDSTGEDTDPADFNTAMVTVDGISFKNCGSSTGLDNRVNFCFTWQATASGNAFPWNQLARTGTSFSGQDWLMSAFDSGETEWNPASTYNTSDKVKYTNDGQDCGLFVFEHCSGISVSNVRGYNDAAYGTIGAIVRGEGKNIRVSDVVVTCDCEYIYRHGITPCATVASYNYERAQDVFIEDVVNLGDTTYIMECDGPVSLADSTLSNEYTPYRVYLKNIHIKETNNTGIVGANVGGAAPSNANISIEAYNQESRGVLRGSPVDLTGLDISSAHWRMIGLDNYQEFSYDETDLTVTGWSAEPTTAVTVTIAGNLVTLSWEELTGTSDSTSTNLGTVIPTAARPNGDVYGWARIRDNTGTVTDGMVYVTTAGAVNFYTDAATTGWTASGTKTVFGGSLSWSL